MEFSCLICSEELLPSNELIDSIATNTVTCCSKCGQTFHTSCVQANNSEECQRCNAKTMKNTMKVCFWVRSFEEAFWKTVEEKEAPTTLKDKMKELDKLIGTFDYFGGEVITFTQEEEAAMGRRGFADQEYSYDKERMRSARYMVQELDSILAFVDLAIEQANHIIGKTKFVKEQEKNDSNPQNEPGQSTDSPKKENEEKRFTKSIIREIACPACTRRLFTEEPGIMPMPSYLESYCINMISCHSLCGYVFHDMCLNQNTGGNQTCPHCKQPILKNNKVKLTFQATPIKDFERPVPESFTGKMGAIKKYLKHMKDMYLEVGQKPAKNKATRNKNKKEKEEIFKRLGQRYKELKPIMSESKIQAETLDGELAGPEDLNKPDGNTSFSEIKLEDQDEATVSKDATTSTSSPKDLKSPETQDKATDSEIKKATPSTSSRKRKAKSGDPNENGPSKPKRNRTK